MSDDQRAGDVLTHRYGCQYPTCMEYAVVNVQFWRGTWGWLPEGDYCAPHADQVIEDHQTDHRKVSIERRDEFGAYQR